MAQNRCRSVVDCVIVINYDLLLLSIALSKRIAPEFRDCPAAPAFRKIPRSMASSRRQYPFHLIEPKWQQFWDEQQTFRAFNPGRRNPGGPSVCPTPQTFRQGGRHAVAAKILHSRHVPLSERRGPARRPSGRLHRHGHPRPLQTRAGFQRAASDGLGRLRPARRAIRHQDRPASAPDHRGRTSPRSSGRFNRSASATTGRANSPPPTRIISNGPSGFSSSFTTRGSIRKRTRPSRLRR